MSECPSARCRAAVGFDWHLVGIQVVTRRRPAVSMPIGSLSGQRRLCSHSSGKTTSARCQYAHRVTVGPTAGLLATRPRSTVGPRIGSLSGQCRICSAYARHLLGKPTSARCWHYSPASRRADARFSRHLVGMPSIKPTGILRSGRLLFAAFGPMNLPFNVVIGPTSGRCRIVSWVAT